MLSAREKADLHNGFPMLDSMLDFLTSKSRTVTRFLPKTVTISGQNRHTQRQSVFDESNEVQHNKTVLFYTRKKYDFTRRSVRNLISYFFIPEKSTILPVALCETSFYPSLSAFSMTFNSVALPVQI